MIVVLPMKTVRLVRFQYEIRFGYRVEEILATSKQGVAFKKPPPASFVPPDDDKRQNPNRK